MSQAPIPGPVSDHSIMSSSAGVTLAFWSENGPECFSLSLTVCPIRPFNLDQWFLFSETGNRTGFFFLVTRHISTTPQVLKCPHLPPPCINPTQLSLKLLLHSRAVWGLRVNLVISQACAYSLLLHALCTFLTQHSHCSPVEIIQG